jgi:hypothetical protein
MQAPGVYDLRGWGFWHHVLIFNAFMMLAPYYAILNWECIKLAVDELELQVEVGEDCFLAYGEEWGLKWGSSTSESLNHRRQLQLQEITETCPSGTL